MNEKKKIDRIETAASLKASGEANCTQAILKVLKIKYHARTKF